MRTRRQPARPLVQDTTAFAAAFNQVLGDRRGRVRDVRADTLPWTPKQQKFEFAIFDGDWVAAYRNNKLFYYGEACYCEPEEIAKIGGLPHVSHWPEDERGAPKYLTLSEEGLEFVYYFANETKADDLGIMGPRVFWYGDELADPATEPGDNGFFASIVNHLGGSGAEYILPLETMNDFAANGPPQKLTAAQRKHWQALNQESV